MQEIEEDMDAASQSDSQRPWSVHTKFLPAYGDGHRSDRGCPDVGQLRVF